MLLYGVVMTFGANCLGLVVFVPLLSRRFVRRRGMAISIVQSANGFARGILGAAVQVLISRHRLARAYLVQARFMAPGVSAARRPVPARRTGGARRPDRARRRPPPPRRRGWTLAGRCARRISGCCSRSTCSPGSAAFWCRCISSPSRSISASTSSTRPRCSAWALPALPGMIFTGTVSDYIGRELSAMLAYGISIIGVVCALFITGPDQHLLLWLHACFFGLTWGARGPAITAKTADLFPGPQLGTILGVITIGTGIGAAPVRGRRAGSLMSPAAIRWHLDSRSSSTSVAALRSGPCAGRRWRNAEARCTFALAPGSAGR